MSKKLRRLVDLAATLSITATTDEARELAARKRHEAIAAIARAQVRLEYYQEVLALFPVPSSCNSEQEKGT